MEKETPESERGDLIEQMLDKIYPIPLEAPRSVIEAIDIDRQSLVMKTDWRSMPLDQLRNLAEGKGSAV